MTAWTALTIFLIVVVGAFTTIAMWLGLIGWLGGVHLVRCTACRHLTMAIANQPQPSCPHCRHPMLTHPLYAAHHPDARVRVRNDPLRY
jgi:hypothetical protein